MSDQDSPRAASALADIAIGPETRGPILLSPGQGCRIDLFDKPGAGYLWRLLEAPLFLSQTPPEPPGPLSFAPGSPIGGDSPLTLRFVATEPGSGRVTLRFGRPWEAAHQQELVFLFECLAPLAEIARSPSKAKP